MFVIVIGAVLTSLGGVGHKKDKQGTYTFALLAALCAALGNAMSKYAMYTLPPLTVSCIAYYCSIPLYLYLLKDKKVLEEVVGTIKNSKHLALFGVRGLLGYVSGLLNMIAMGIGVVSLVTAIGGSQPIMILIISLIASFLFPRVIYEELGRNALIPKLAALLLTVSGVLLISL